LQTLAAVECKLDFDIGEGTLALGAGVFLARLPDWIKGNDVLDAYGRQTREHVLEKATYALFLDVELVSFDEVEKDWKGPQAPKRIDEALSKLSFALIAFWVHKPAAILARAVVQFANEAGQQSRFTTWPEFALLPKEETGVFSRIDMDGVAELNKSIQGLTRPHTPWLAIRMLQGALIEVNWELRYLTMWIVLETLFGPTGATETSHQLAERIAVFLEHDVGQREHLYRRIKTAYRYRSRIAHGDSWNVPGNDSLEWLGITEAIVRAALQKILRSPTLIERFASERDRYLRLRCLGLGEDAQLPAAQ